MQCPQCAAEVAEVSRFCPNCGALLASEGGDAPARVAPARRATPEAEHRQVTVMFCDLVGSTELSERLQPDDLRETIRAYQACCAEVVGRFDGHVAKFLGDGVLASFGYPHAHEDDAERAVRAALEMVDAVAELAPVEGVRLQARIGISTGPVVVTDLVGTGQELLGEPVNRAARLQALAKPGEVTIGPRTHRLLGALFEYADLGEQRFKGFEEVTRAWRVLGPGRAPGRFAALHRASLTPLVAREHELGLLLDRWQRAREGEGQVLLLTGEPGIGKSRVVQALCDAITDRTHRLIHYQCLPYYQNSALQPVIDELERAAGIVRGEGADARWGKLESHLARIGIADRLTLQLLAELLLIPPADRQAPGQPSLQHLNAPRFDALVRRLVALANRAPVLIVVEDAHWIDPTSREFLERVSDRLPDLPALLVVTMRPDGIPLRIAHANATVLGLNRLSRRQAATLAQQVAGQSLGPEALDQIVVKGEGVPLYLEELTKAAVEAGSVSPRDGSFELGGVLAPVAIPASLQDSLAARLDRLGPLKELAQIGAVIGREFPQELIAAVAEWPERELESALGQLVDAGLLLCRGSPPDAVYSFRHALVQDAAYQALVRERRKGLHERIARVLASDFPEVMASNPELIAHHCTEAGLDEEAVEFWRDAGEMDLVRGSPREAAADLGNALRILSRFPESGPRNRTELGLQTALGNALIAAKGFAAPETGAAFARASALSQQLGDPTRRLPVLFGRWIFHIARAEVRETLEAGDEMVRLAEEQGNAAAFLVAQRAMANTWFFLGDLARAQTHAEEVIARYDRARHRALANDYSADPYVMAAYFLAHTLLRRGFPERALKPAAEALAWARELGHVVTLAHALHHGCLFHQLRRESPVVLQQAEELSRLAVRHGLPFWAALARIFRGWGLAGTGHPSEGARELRDGIDAHRATGGRLYLPYALALLGDVSRELGEVEEGLRAVAEGLALMRETGVHGFEAHLHRVEGTLHLARAQPDAAAACFERAVGIARQQGARLSELRAATDLARLWRDQHKEEEAFELLEPLYGQFTEGFATPDLREAKALLDELGRVVL